MMKPIENGTAAASPVTLLAGLELLEIACGEMAIFTSSSGRQTFRELLETEEGRREVALKFSLLRQACEAKDARTFKKMVAALKAKAEQKKAANQAKIKEKMDPIEQRIRTLQLLYKNTKGKPEAYIFPVHPQKFIGAQNPSHFEALKQWLRQRFYSYKMEGVISYLGTTETVKTAGQAKEWASVAEEVKSLFVGHFTQEPVYRKLIQFLQRRFKITGIAPKFAHLVFPATWGYAAGSFKDVAETQRRAVPLDLALIGKLMSVPPGEYISSLEKPPIDGIEGVTTEYELETLDSSELQELGANMILDSGEIMGTSTGNKSDNIDLVDFHTMDLINAIDKALIRMLNAKAHSKWGTAQADELQEDIEDYFARLAKAGLIQDPTPVVTIAYDANDQKVNIHLDGVAYYRTATFFEITMQGKRQQLKMEKKAD